MFVGWLTVTLTWDTLSRTPSLIILVTLVFRTMASQNICGEKGLLKTETSCLKNSDSSVRVSKPKASFFCTVELLLLILADWWEISIILKTAVKKLCVADRGQRQHKITGYCKAREKAIAQLLTLQMLSVSAEAVLLFWQHCWDLYVLTGDQGNISWLTTRAIVESLYETDKDALTDLHLIRRRACFSRATCCRM